LTKAAEPVVLRSGIRDRRLDESSFALACPRPCWSPSAAPTA
jgi:hypothetical protein